MSSIKSTPTLKINRTARGPHARKSFDTEGELPELDRGQIAAELERQFFGGETVLLADVTEAPDPWFDEFNERRAELAYMWTSGGKWRSAADWGKATLRRR